METAPTNKKSHADKLTTKDLTGKVIIITGSNSGIGKAAAKQLAKTGATIILACRNASKTEPVVEELRKKTGNNSIEFIQLDLSDFKSIERFVKDFKEKYQRLDILINNAGLVSLTHEKTKDGFELMMGTNHLGHFYLTMLLLDTLKKSAPARVINVSGNLYKRAKPNWGDLMYEKTKFNGFQAGVNAALARILFTKELQRRVEGSNIKVVSLHPGIVATGFGKEEFKKKLFYNILMNGVFAPLMKVFAKSPEQGAKTTVYCALEDQEKLVGGGYYDDCKIAKESDVALNEENQRKLWEISEKLISSKVSNGM